MEECFLFCNYKSINSELFFIRAVVFVQKIYIFQESIQSNVLWAKESIPSFNHWINKLMSHIAAAIRYICKWCRLFAWEWGKCIKTFMIRWEKIATWWASHATVFSTRHLMTYTREHSKFALFVFGWKTT